MLEFESASALYQVITSEEAAARAATAIPMVPGYQIEKEVGSGASGVVFRAVAQKTGQRVALKLIHRRDSDPESTARNWRELNVLDRVQSPGVPRILDYGEVDGQLYIISEFIEGSHITDFVEERCGSQHQVLRLLIELCETVQSVHEFGVIHCDLKPSNILVAPDGHAHVVDFGIATLDNRSPRCVLDHRAPVGTPGFMAPEQARGDADAISTRSDVYAIGAIARRLLTGNPPHRPGDDLLEWCKRIATHPTPDVRNDAPGLSADLAAVLNKATAFEPSDRYGSAHELRQDLERIVCKEPVVARVPTKIEQVHYCIRKHPAIASCVFLIGVAAIAMQVQHAYWHHKTEEQIKLMQETVEFTLMRVLDEYKVRIGSMSARQDLLAALTPEVEWLRAALPHDPDTAALAVKVLLHRADLAEGESDFVAGYAACLRANAILAEIATAADEQPEFTRLRARTLVRTGDLGSKAIDRAQAERWYRRAHQELLEGFGRRPDHIGLRDDLFWSWDRLRMWVPEHKQLDWYEKQITRANALVAVAPDRPLSHFAEATALSRLAHLLIARQEPESHQAATDLFERSYEVSSMLVEVEPNRLSFIESRIIAARGLFEIAREIGDRDLVIDAADRLDEAMAALDPGHVGNNILRGVVRRSLLQMHRGLADVGEFEASDRALLNAEQWQDLL
ncbi:MAG: serine/threonine-protein kinase [Phycisphaerales bacterium]